MKTGTSGTVTSRTIPAVEVARQHPGDEEQRHDDREDGLGEVAGEVGLERVDALHCGGDQLAGATVAQARRARPQDVLAEAST